MNVFGKLTTLARGAGGGLGAQIARIDDWSPGTPAKRTNYHALWEEVLAPFHPILDERVRLRVREKRTDEPFACSQPPVTDQIDALDEDTAAKLAVETLRRFAFVDHCNRIIAGQVSDWYEPALREREGRDPVDPLFIGPDPLAGFSGDLHRLVDELFHRSSPRLNTEQIEVVARIVGFVAEPPTGIGAMVRTITPILCDPGALPVERRRLALRRLFDKIGECEALAQCPLDEMIALAEALASCIDVDPNTHPIVSVKLAREALKDEGRQATLEVAGPRLASWLKDAFGKNVFDGNSCTADVSSIDALSSIERGRTLFDCLRVINFTRSCGSVSNEEPWLGFKLSSFDPARYPQMGKYEVIPWYGHGKLEDLFQYLAKRKVELDEEMQFELLALLRADRLAVIRSLQVVKMIERFTSGACSPRVRDELAALIERMRANGGSQIQASGAASPGGRP